MRIQQHSNWARSIQTDDNTVRQEDEERGAQGRGDITERRN